MVLKKRKPKHKRPYPYNKSAYWQIKDLIKMKYRIMCYWWRDQVDEVKDIIIHLRNR